uniref:RRM domain-containing protein n=1 Tax=Nannospalax galili TaxID=1026970 RepID=A0A8C6QTH2_NANGA
MSGHHGCRGFIRRLNLAARDKDVERFFKDIDLKRGLGFVGFEDPRDADDVVHELHRKELCSERVAIEHAQAWARGGRDRGCNSDRFSKNQLIGENLSSRVSWQPICDLKDFMRQAGEVTFADAHRPKLNEGVNATEKLSGKEINWAKIKLIKGSKRHRSRSRSRSWTRSSSRSCSQSHSHRSKSRNRSQNKSSSVSRSPVPEKSQKRGSSSRSKSPASVDRQRSRSRSRPRSVDSGN